MKLRVQNAECYSLISQRSVYRLILRHGSWGINRLMQYFCLGELFALLFRSSHPLIETKLLRSICYSTERVTHLTFYQFFFARISTRRFSFWFFFFHSSNIAKRPWCRCGYSDATIERTSLHQARREKRSNRFQSYIIGVHNLDV